MRETQEGRALDERLGVLIAQHHALGAEIAGVLAEMHELDAWQGEGLRTMAQWLSIRGGYAVEEARRFQTVAMRLETVEPIVADARAGRFSMGVVAMAARIATPENLDTVRQILHDATPTQAGQVFAKYRDCKTQSGDPEPDPDVDYWRRRWTDDLGRERWDLALDTATSAALEQAWEAARAAGERDIDPMDGEQRRRLNANEIAGRIAAMMIDAVNSAGMTAAGDRYCVQVSVDLAMLARVLGFDFDPTAPVGLGSHAFLPATGKRLTDSELATILCGASLQMLVHHDGVPLWLGHEIRDATRQQRRAMMFRAGAKGCEFPGCTQTRFVDAHHVRWVSEDGPTDLDNLVFLCGYHHKQIHDRVRTITTDGDQQFTFWRGERCLGSTVRGDRPGRPPDLTRLPMIGDLPSPASRFTHRTPSCNGGGEPLSRYALGLYIEHLLAA